jgi:DNA-binding transcriptional ArsR family regulator
MSLSLVFGPDDPARTRFVVSPLWETMHALRVIIEPQRHHYHLPWLEAVRPEVERLDLRPLMALSPRRGWTPDFLSPIPAGRDVDVPAELARVRATPPDQVAEEIRRSLTERAGAPVPPGGWELLDDAAATRDLAADLLEQCWRLLVAPHWPRLRERLEADVAFRTQTLADYGLERVLSDLHPRVRWTGRALLIEGMQGRCHLGGAGLLLMPSVFGWPSLAATSEPPAQPSLAYPARGIAEMWQPARTAQSDALARLLGQTRAALLESLAEPASTHTLARRHDLAPSTVSEHLSALRDARLVSSRRQRHAVMYQQTQLGVALASGG